MIRILHTSDWHIGRTLYGRRRYEEHARFLDWLVALLVEKQVDVLLVAGDIFDTIAPTNRAQELYYRFLHRAAATGCRHMVITGGNHDSSSFLDAPKALLAALQIHVIGSAPEEPEEEVRVLRNAEGMPEVVICAVPFLRERDIRLTEAGESMEDKERKLSDGIRRHYERSAEAAVRVRQTAEEECKGAIPVVASSRIPIIAMGHLFTAGGAVQEDDGVRELYVGSLAHVPVDAFPNCFDYVALGHLHVPQRVGGADRIRYSGSPLPMGFGEAGQRKQVCLVSFEGEPVPGELKMVVEAIPIPVFQTLSRVVGDWETIEKTILTRKTTMPDAWLEVTYTGDAMVGNLRERLEVLVAGTGLELLRIRNERLVERTLASIKEEETLDDLNDSEVFVRCMDAHEIPEEQRTALAQAYREIVTIMHETDVNAD